MPAAFTIVVALPVHRAAVLLSWSDGQDMGQRS